MRAQRLFNRSGTPVMLEDCHNGNPYTPVRMARAPYHPVRMARAVVQAPDTSALTTPWFFAARTPNAAVG